ncbi:zinc-binding protein A33 [Corythoichthys intestinalis]|uniref:zinc-binding protein A33 n=1 Tax=Corythoichthys intestinalis TaxID=161448 RepID=UPI0025A515BB|nr:zinc-binding protein A33 [Corythoichthys intestinalis]
MYGNYTNNICNRGLLSEYKDKLIQAIKRIQHEADDCREAENETYVESVKLESQFDSLEREIRAEFGNLHRYLDEEERKYLERLKTEQGKALKRLKERENAIYQQRKDLEGAIAVLNAKLSEEESANMLKDIQDLIKRSQVRFIPPAELDRELHSSYFVGPIQYRIWKHMKSSLYPNITQVVFDKDTAHHLLSMSSSCTSVWFDDTKEAPECCRDNPKRFHYYYCVLGREGFSVGRHYWEVEVGNKTAWRLGVARADMPRGEMAATGTSSGLWTLALKNGDILACTDPTPAKVNVPLSLSRVGVFLDCEREEVSFYNAENMSPVYTFATGTLLVPVHPFFNPCDTDDGRNTAPIRIFSPSL